MKAFNRLKCQSVNSVSQSCLTLFDLVDSSTPGFPVYHQLLEFTQTHVCWVGDAIHLILCHPLLLPTKVYAITIPKEGKEKNEKNQIWNNGHTEWNKSEKAKYHMASIISLTYKEMIQMNLFTKQKQTHRFREWIYGCLRGGGGGIVMEFGIDMCTLLYLNLITNSSYCIA